MSIRALLIILIVLVATGVGALCIHFFCEPSKTQAEIAEEAFKEAIRSACRALGEGIDSCRAYERLLLEGR
jgi:flagellar basal body-associated protein FliL